VALGRALTGGVLLGALLKGRQRVALKFEGNGPLGKIVVEADPMCLVHGYVGNPAVDLPLKDGCFDIPGALGRAGLLTVTKDLLLKSPYQGVVNLVSSEIAEDIAYYLTDSEQTPSAMGLTAIPDDAGNIVVAGGFLIQSLPPANDEALDVLTGRIRTLPPLAKLLSMAPPRRSFWVGSSGISPSKSSDTRTSLFTVAAPRSHRAGPHHARRGRNPVPCRPAEDTVITCEFCREPYAFTPDDLHKLANERH
jgi:Disulfide bond chaperones of the HSP33 family